MAPAPFPTDWTTAVILVPHPDDPEYVAAAVAKWVASGRQVSYVLGSRGEAGIAGMAAEEAATVREAEQRRAAAIVGVQDVVFWDEPDSNIRNTAALRETIARTLTAIKPQVVVTVFGGAEWAPEVPNQRDHREFAVAVEQAYDAMIDPPRWLFVSGVEATHVEVVDEFIDQAVASLAAHEQYLKALDPDTPPAEQAREQLRHAVPARPDMDGRRVVQFLELRG